METVDILGVRIHNADMDETVSRIETFLSERKKQYAIFTPNVDFIVKAQKDKEFRDILNAADLSVPDGKWLVWGGRFLGKKLKEKVSGSGLFFRLCETSAAKGYRIFLLGAAPGVADKAKTRLQDRYPGLNIVGTYSPPMGFENDRQELEKTFRAVSAASPDILIVGLGAPKQERFIFEHKKDCGAVVSLGLGASIDFAAGVIRMPPNWMKKSGTAWLWRLIREPRRLWKRYLVDDMRFFYYLLKQRIKEKKISGKMP